MKRLILNSAVASFVAAILAYVACRIILALASPPEFDEWLAFVSFALTGVGIMFPTLVIQGCVALPIERRLVREFRLIDLWPTTPGYERTVVLTSLPSEFVDQVKDLIAAGLQVLSVTEDGSRTSLACRVRHAILYVYEVRVRLSEDSATAAITVCRCGGPLSLLVTVEVGAVQVLGGILKWAADRDLIARDFGPFSRLDRLDKDLGNWLPSGAVAHSDLEAVVVRRPLRGLSIGRLLIATLLALTMSFALAGIGASLFVRVIPLLLLAVYVQALIVRAAMGPRSKSAS